MKKHFAIAFLAALSTVARADVTNYVYTVSNIYIRTSEVRYITNRVQNTHYNYYHTNNVTTITNIWTINHVTNYNYNVVNTNFGPWIVTASNQANRASSAAVAATNMANVAAGHATAAGSYSSAAQAYAAQAQTTVNNGLSSINQGLSQIEGKISQGLSDISGSAQNARNSVDSTGSYWLDQLQNYAGQMVTNVNIYNSSVTNVSVQNHYNYNYDYSTTTNVVLTTNLTYATVTNVYIRNTTITNLVQDYSETTNITINVTTNTVLHKYYTTTTNLTINVTTNLEFSPDTYYTYKSPDGTEYGNIRYYVLPQANGRVCATPSANESAATSWVLYMRTSQSGSGTTDDAFYFDIGYVSSNAEGMTINFVPRDRTLVRQVFYGITRLILPRGLYWQSGNYVAVFDIYSDATNYVGRWSRTLNKAFPVMHYGNQSDSQSGSGYTLSFTTQKEHSGYSGFPYSATSSSPSTTLRMRTPYQCYLPSGTSLWVPDAPSAEQAEIIKWLNNFPH